MRVSTLVVLSPLVFVGTPARAQTNPCDLNLDGSVNFEDVVAAVQMMDGQLQCTADILGTNTCNQAVVQRISFATRSSLCITGQPPLPFLVTLLLSPNIVLSGQSAIGTVTLNGPAGSGGVLVSLNSSSSSIHIPASVAVAEGATSATFSIASDSVDDNTPALLTASSSGLWATAEMTIDSGATLSLAGLTVVPGSLAASQSATGTLELTGPAPAGGASVALSSNNPGISFPATVQVAEGSTSANFVLTAGPVTNSIIAELWASYGGVTSSVDLPITPAAVAVTLTWVSSVSPNIAGYNIYRGSVSGGPYTLMNTALVPGTSYVDSTVFSGLTYYYVSTAVDTSNDESGFSNETAITLP